MIQDKTFIFIFTTTGGSHKLHDSSHFKFELRKLITKHRKKKKINLYWKILVFLPMRNIRKKTSLKFSSKFLQTPIFFSSLLPIIELCALELAIYYETIAFIITFVHKTIKGHSEKSYSQYICELISKFIVFKVKQQSYQQIGQKGREITGRYLSKYKYYNYIPVSWISNIDISLAYLDHQPEP